MYGYFFGFLVFNQKSKRLEGEVNEEDLGIPECPNFRFRRKLPFKYGGIPWSGFKSFFKKSKTFWINLKMEFLFWKDYNARGQIKAECNFIGCHITFKEIEAIKKKNKKIIFII